MPGLRAGEGVGEGTLGVGSLPQFSGPGLGVRDLFPGVELSSFSLYPHCKLQNEASLSKTGNKQ